MVIASTNTQRIPPGLECSILFTFVRTGSFSKRPFLADLKVDQLRCALSIYLFELMISTTVIVRWTKVVIFKRKTYRQV